jgi:hypothetical protein
MFEPAVKTYLTELQQERDAEAAMEAEAAADAAAEAAAAGESSSSSSGGGEEGGGVDASSTWDDAELMRRIRAVRWAKFPHKLKGYPGSGACFVPCTCTRLGGGSL